MEITIPEKVLFETEIYEIDDNLRVKEGKVKITENRVLVRSNGNLKLLYISGVQMLEIRKGERWGHFLAGCIFLVSSVIMYLFGVEYGIRTFTSALFFFIFPTIFLSLALILIYWWFVTRSYLLEISTDFGRKVKIRSKCREDLIEIANALELVKMGAVRRLQVGREKWSERSFV